MPELPEVETVRRGLAPALEGEVIRQVVVNRPDLRWPFPDRFAERIEGAMVDNLSRRAKYLLADLSSGEVLILHLGMSGSFRVVRPSSDAEVPGTFHHARSKAPAHDHVMFETSSGTQVIFNDPRRFGFMLLVPRPELDRHPLMAGLGPEPLASDFDTLTLARACAGKRAEIKTALLDQKVVAGLGNIYVCEALHRAGVTPQRSAGTLVTKRGVPTPRAAAIVDAIKSVLHEAIEAGGSSLRDHRRTDGELGYFQHTFRVYDREGRPCASGGCDGVIRRIVQGGRSTFYCPKCQR